MMPSSLSIVLVRRLDHDKSSFTNRLELAKMFSKCGNEISSNGNLTSDRDLTTELNLRFLSSSSAC